MGRWKLRCKAHEFGCMETRTRREAMEKHCFKCPYVTRYAKWLCLEAENKKLREQIKQLQIQKGRPNIELAVDLEKFGKFFLKRKGLHRAWRELFNRRHENAVYALIRLFLACSPRFYKVLPCKRLVEVKGYLHDIRTSGEIHTVRVN